MPKNALECAIDFLWPHYTDAVIPKMVYAERSAECQALARLLTEYGDQRASEATSQRILTDFPASVAALQREARAAAVEALYKIVSYAEAQPPNAFEQIHRIASTVLAGVDPEEGDIPCLD